MKKIKTKRNWKSMIALGACLTLSATTIAGAISSTQQINSNVINKYDNRSTVLSRERTGNSETLFPKTNQISNSLNKLYNQNIFDNNINDQWDANQAVESWASTFGSGSAVNITGSLIGGRPMLANDCDFNTLIRWYIPRLQNWTKEEPQNYSPKKFYEGFIIAFVNYLYNAHNNPTVWSQIQNVFGKDSIDEQLYFDLSAIKNFWLQLNQNPNKQLLFDEQLNPQPDFSSQTFNFKWNITDPDKDGKKLFLNPGPLTYKTPEQYGFNYDLSIGTQFSPLTPSK